MPEYEQSLIVHASPDAVFDFISDVRNLPQYLPTLRRAEPSGNERVRVEGDVRGHHYAADGQFHVDRLARRMEWGSDGEMQYRGWMTVEDAGRSQSEVTVHLSFTPPPQMSQKMDQMSGDHHAAIQEGLEQALQSIQNLVEGTGGKVSMPSER